MIVDFNQVYYPYDRFIEDVKKLVKQYDGILHNVTIGRSHGNRDIVMLGLGVGRHYMTVCAGVHARENINPIVLLKIIEYYADLYVNHKQQKQNLKRKLLYQKQHLKAEYEQMLYGACIYELLQTFTILFVPILNPDGYMISLDGYDSIDDRFLREKCIEMKIPAEEWKYNARGVDLNRNFPSRLWRKKSDQDHTASENETQALIYLFQAYRSKGFLDLHSRGKQIYYYRNQMDDRYNAKQSEIAGRLRKITSYTLMPPDSETVTGDSGGNTVHYFSEQFQKPALTIETVDEEATFPLDAWYRFSTFEELKFVISEFGSMIV